LNLNKPWSEEKPRLGAVLMISGPTRQIPAQEELFRIRGGATSALGRALRDSEI
jgi:hypothetical protein